MLKIMIVGAGGFFGAIFRFTISGLVNNNFSHTSFPLGTLVVNIMGCFAIGILFSLLGTKFTVSAETQLLLIVGFIGSFTTFASFGHETLNLIQADKFNLSLINIAAQMLLGFGSIIAGRWTTEFLIK